MGRRKEKRKEGLYFFFVEKATLFNDPDLFDVTFVVEEVADAPAVGLRLPSPCRAARGASNSAVASVAPFPEGSSSSRASIRGSTPGYAAPSFHRPDATHRAHLGCGLRRNSQEAGDPRRTGACDLER